jgi:hypothetical protein
VEENPPDPVPVLRVGIVALEIAGADADSAPISPNPAKEPTSGRAVGLTARRPGDGAHAAGLVIVDGLDDFVAGVHEER